jgi:hypothetical protein
VNDIAVSYHHFEHICDQYKDDPGIVGDASPPLGAEKLPVLDTPETAD